MDHIEHQQLIIRRLVEQDRAIAFQIEKLKAAHLKNYKEEKVKELLYFILEEERKHVEQTLKGIEEGYLKGYEEVVSEHIRVEVDHVLYLLESIINQEISEELYNFFDVYIDFLNLENISVIALKGDYLGCFCLNDLLIHEFNIYPPETFTRLWVIICPVRFEYNPFDWILMLHELAHIIEVELTRLLREINLLERYYPLPSVETRRGLTISHTLEYLCDLMAYMLVGPVYLFRIFDQYLTEEFLVPKSHPEWVRRVEYLLKNKGKEIIELDKIYSNESNKKVKSIYSLIEEVIREIERIYDYPPRVKDLPEMLEKKISFQEKNFSDFLKCFNRIRKFKPYIDNIITLLNVSYLVMRNREFSDEIINFFKKNFRDEWEIKMHSEFLYLISDCIKLSRILNYVKKLLSTPEET